MKTALVLGAGGFIGGQMANRLAGEGYWVRGVDLRRHEFMAPRAQEFVLGDLRDRDVVRAALAAPDGRPFDEVYQFAADMGGAGYVFTGAHDASIMANSAAINLNVADCARAAGVRDLFFASSACVYPQETQADPEAPDCAEDSAYPANPDSDYGWEKLFAERLYLAHNRQYGTRFRIGRYHNVFGPFGTWRGGREKAPAAICRKVAEAPEGGEIEVWGDGRQTRSFLFVDEAIEATRRLMQSRFLGPVNIGSQERVTINELAQMAIGLSGKSLSLRHVPGPQGVRGRNSDNRLIRRELGWAPAAPLRDGMAATLAWIAAQVGETVA